jgi:hypothetical protein
LTLLTKLTDRMGVWYVNDNSMLSSSDSESS